MERRKEGTEGTDDQRLNAILRWLDLIGGACNPAKDAAAFIRAQNTRLENAEIVLRAARQVLDKVWLEQAPFPRHNLPAAISLITDYLDRPLTLVENPSTGIDFRPPAGPK
jgi:hypothetical protein